MYKNIKCNPEQRPSRPIVRHIGTLMTTEKTNLALDAIENGQIRVSAQALRGCRSGALERGAGYSRGRPSGFFATLDDTCDA